MGTVTHPCEAVALPARTLTRPGAFRPRTPRASRLRAVPGLASLPVVLAALACFPPHRAGGLLRLCRSLRAGARVCFAASRPCARPRFRPVALAPSGAAAGGVGLGFLPVPVARSLRAFRRSCGGGAVAPVGRCQLLWGCAVASFSLVSSRAVVVSRGSLVSPLSAPWWRSLVGSALAAGACRWRVRSSRRSFSSAVVVVGFASSARASAFAAAWSGWVGFPLAVRRFAGRYGTVFGVSVPVAVPPALRLAAPAVLPAPLGWVRA